jgi:hypothetical protein
MRISLKEEPHPCRSTAASSVTAWLQMGLMEAEMAAEMTQMKFGK